MYEPSLKVRELRARLESFMAEHIYPNEDRFMREAVEAGPWRGTAVTE